MKRATVLLCVVVFFAIGSRLSAQVGNWYPQLVPSIVGQLYDIDMFDTQFGAAVGVPNSAAMWTGVLFTFDGGNTWEPIITDRFDPPMPGYAVWRSVHILNNMNIVIAGDSGLVYTTTDGGITWRDKSPALKLLGPMRPTLRSVFFKDAHEGYVVGGDRDAPMPPPPPPPTPPAVPNTPIIYKTTDYGKTWTDESPAPNALYGNPRMFSVKYGSGLWLACGEFSTVVSRGGSTWSALQKPSVNPYELYRQINIIDANNWTVSGQNVPNNLPRLYQTSNAGTRWLNSTPNNYPAGVEDIPSHFAFSPTELWVGSSMAYLAATTNGGPVWKNFLVAGVSTPGVLEKMDFTDPLNGWACGDGWIIRYFGVPPKADISRTQKSAMFPDITCERSVEIVVTVRNTGTGELVVPAGGIKFSSSEFSAPGLVLPFKLLPGRGKQITVRWTPNRTSYGVVQASMTVLSNDPDHNPWDIALEGKRIYGTLDIASTIDVYPGTCIKDSVDYTQYANTGGNRPPTFVGIEFVSGNNEFRLLSPKPGTIINGTQPFFFRFYPTQPGLRKATFRIISGNTSCPDTAFFDITGTGDHTKLVSNVAEVDFGKVCINTIRDTSITLTNIGNTYAFVERRELKGGVDMFPTPEIIPLLIKVDSSKKYRVQFTPQLTGAFAAEYRIISSPCPDTIIVRFKGEGISTELTFTPRGAVTVGPTFVNRQVSRVVSVKNTGKTPANITSVRLAKLFPDLLLTGVPPLPVLLPPGNSFDVTIVFNPQIIETLETQLLVAFNSTCADTTRLDVIAPCLPNPYIDPPAAMDVGLQPCSKPIRDTLYVRNKGNGPLVFLSSSFTGTNPTHFKLISPSIGDSIRAKDSIRLIVEYDRPSEGLSTAGLFLNHNDLDHLPTFIALAGRRTVAEFTVFGDSITEFFTRIFIPQTRRYTLRNTSNQSVTITGATVQKSAAVFSISPSTPLPVTLAPNSSTDIDVIFTPNGRGPFNGLIRFTSLPCSYTSLLSLDGRGDTEGLSVDRGNIEYQLDPCSFTAMFDTLHLNNQGGNAVTITGLSITQAGSVFAITPPISVPFTLQGNQTQDVIISSDPSFLGSANGTLNIKSTDPVVPSINVSLASHRDSSNVTVSSTDIDFGRMVRCSSGFTRDITITNNGSAQEVINTVLGGSSSAFTSTAPPSIILQAGKSFTFTVAFTHQAFGYFADTLHLVTERCSQATQIVLRAAWIEQVYAAAPKPLIFPSVNIGTSSIRPLNIQNNGGFDAHIAAITVNPPGEFIVQPGYPTTITAGNSVSAQLRFTPTSEGPKAATACIVFDTPCPDTLCIDLQGTGVRGRIILSRATMSFGTLAQCQQAIVVDTLTNGGTGSINVLSATITGSGSAAFSNLTPVPATEALAPGNTRIFRLQYNAALAPADGPVLANLQIVTDDPIQPVVDIPLDGVRETLRPDGGGTIGFGLVEIGKQSQQTWTIRNTGSAQLCYTADRKPPEITFTPALPFCIDPGKSVNVTLTFSPASSGAWTGKLSLLTTAPCADSTVLNLDGRAQQGTIGLAGSVNFGSDAWCVSHTEQVTISNSYLVDITLDSLRLSGTEAASFTIQSPNTFPQTIVSGGTLTVTLRFSGQNASRPYGAALSSFFTALGSQVSKITTLTAVTASPSLSATSVAFGTAVIGQAPVSGTSTIRNTSTLPVQVQSLTPSNPAFTVRSTTPPLPAILQPGESMTVQLEFAPTQARTFSDSLVLLSQQPCPFSISSGLSGLSIPQPIVRATISAASIDGTPGQLVMIPILVDKDLGGASITSWKGSVAFNRSMLYPIRVVTAGTSSSAMNVTMSYVHDSGKVVLQASGAIATAGSQPLAFIECQVLLGDAVQTPLRVSTDFDFTSGYATVIGRSDGMFSLLGYCVSNGRLVTDRSGNMLMQNRPNPVSIDNAASTSISYSIANDGFVDLSLFDVMGRQVMAIVHDQLPKGTHEVRVNLSLLPAGVYQYTLSTGEFVATRKLVITR